MTAMAVSRYDVYQQKMEAGGKVFRQGVSFDRSQWDAMYRSITGAAPGRATVDSLRHQLDADVRQAAMEVKEKVREDTPVLTGTLQGSIDLQHNGPADHSVVTYLHYAPIVEARPPGGPEKGKGAMFAQNLGFAMAALNRAGQRFLNRRAR